MIKIITYIAVLFPFVAIYYAKQQQNKKLYTLGKIFLIVEFIIIALIIFLILNSK